ncbi:MAG: phosphohydrolase [Firmicutes bacterium]|nr:phosphohydrolase [Bacillota bacterium]
MDRISNLDIYNVLSSELYDGDFLDNLGWSDTEMDKFISGSMIKEFADRVSNECREGSKGYFFAPKVLDLAKEYILELRKEPSQGWLKYCFDYTESILFPETKGDVYLDDHIYHEGRLLLLQILRGLYKFEDETLPFDPTRTMDLLSGDTGGNTWEEYLKFKAAIKREYIYEFMRIARDITPFDTLGHMSGVHYVAMTMGHQLKAAKVPVDLPLISGAAAGHDIGKFGCTKEEAGRIPYLHYYYTDICYERFGLENMGHIAANHSTWDLELENLSVESLLLIYADFRVKSDKDQEGKERVRFYSLDDAFDVILSKLDNVDAAKEARYRKVYAKLKDFESYMHELGVETTLPENLGIPTINLNPIERERVLLEGDAVIEQFKYSAIDHNIRLMSILHVDSELADLIEAARSETAWKNVRTYVGIFDEYSTYMSERQKIMTMRFLYELLAHGENDIRTQAADLMGEITAGFNIKYKKELPKGVELPKKPLTNLELFDEYVEKIIYPERRFTEQHKSWMWSSLGNYVSAVLLDSDQEEKKNYIERLNKYYSGENDDSEMAIVLMGVLDRLDPSWCSDAFLEGATDMITASLAHEKVEVRIAALRAERHFLKDMSEEKYYETLLNIMELPHNPADLLERDGTVFLDDLKMGTHWMIKVANTQIIRHFGRILNNPAVTLHIGTHLVNLLKVNERAEIRRAAGNALLDLMPLMPDSQRNELAVELYNGLEIGDRQFAKNIPYYMGKMSLSLPPKEFDEVIDTVEVSILKTSRRVAAFMIEAVGVILENYHDFSDKYPETREYHEERKVRLLYTMIKAYSHYDRQYSRDAFRDIGRYVFASEILPDEDKKMLFSRTYKKILQLLDESSEDMLSFYSNAAVLNHIYRYIGHHEHIMGSFGFREPEKVCFYPGTFDPFSLAHKAVAMRIRDLGFSVYLALDEFSWSKHTQPKIQRRKIMTMSTAGEEGIYSFPDDIPINIANNVDVARLKSLFKDKELYVAVGTDVIENASAYAAPPEQDSIHTLSHITFERETRENVGDKTSRNYPITGDVIELTLDKFYEDISSTRIRENIDLNRDISNIIDPVAQNYIYENNMYLREPTYKHVIESREIEITNLEHRGPETLDSIFDELDNMGYDLDALQTYVANEQTKSIYITDAALDNKVIAYAACHKVGTRNILSEFGSEDLAARIRSLAGSSIYSIGFFYADENSGVSGISQMLITELLTELIARDHDYAIYHPICERGYDEAIITSLKKQGFIDIAGRVQGYYDSGIPNTKPTYAVAMEAPVVIFKDVETVLKAPFNKNDAVLDAVSQAHDNLLSVLAKIYPGKLILSFNTSAIQNKIIAKACALNGVSTEDGKSQKGPYMVVPFGKALGDVLVPNTVTKTLYIEKFFNRNVKGFTIAEANNYSPLETQAKMIKSFNRPVILIDDLLHKSHRVNILGPLLNKVGCQVKEVLVGVMTGNAVDKMEANNIAVESAYFLPKLEIWFNERDCYPYIGGDSLASAEGRKDGRSAAANLILPYIKPGFVAGGDEEASFMYSEVCLKNARLIMGTLEREYQKLFERKLTLKRLGEVITRPRIPETDRGVTFDENLEPTNFLDNDIERLSRLKWGDS